MKTQTAAPHKKIVPQLLLLALPVVGSLILLHHVPPQPPPQMTPPDIQAQMGRPWIGPRRWERAAVLTARVHIGMDQQAVKAKLGSPDRMRDTDDSPPREMWSYWCRDTRQHFIFVNGKLQSEETLPYQGP